MYNKWVDTANEIHKPHMHVCTERENMDQALCIMNALQMIVITTLKDKYSKRKGCLCITTCKVWKVTSIPVEFDQT